MYRWTKEVFLREEHGKLYQKQKKLTSGICCGSANSIKKHQKLLNSTVLFPDSFGNVLKNKNKNTKLYKNDIESINHEKESNKGILVITLK